MRPKQRKRRSRESIRMPEDITEEELENVADRAKDKILDKENVSGASLLCCSFYVFVHDALM